MEQAIIYHYTSDEHLKKIVESGWLKVSEWERKNKVRPPALWLSLNQVWEQTASKMIRQPDGTVIQLSMQQQHETIGLVRFVVPFDKTKLCTWAAYKHKSNTPESVYYEMERAGKQKGANPSEWFASFRDIPLKECIRVEKWNGEKWEIHTGVKIQSPIIR